MSVIHDALKKADVQAPPTVPFSSQTPGMSGTGSNRNPKGGASLRVVVVGILILVVACAGSWRWFHLRSTAKKTESEVAVSPAVPMLESVVQPPTGLAVDEATAAKSYESANYPDARRQWMALSNQNPSDARALYYVGLCDLKMGNMGSSEKYLRESLVKDENCSVCYNALGLLQSRKGKKEEALRSFESAAMRDPTYPDPYFNSAVLYEADGRLKEAVTYYSDFVAMSKDPKSAIVVQVNQRIKTLLER